MKKEYCFRLKSIFLLPMLFLLIMAMSMVGRAQTAATVLTDKADYMPGEVVKISGANWFC
jgi:hypothetical protein